MNMDLFTTLALAAAAMLAAVFCGWRGARASQPGKAPRLVPWRMLMALFCVVALALLVHLVAVIRGH
jgi:hypothetical protein